MAAPKFSTIAQAGGTHYDVLSVGATATSEEIRKAFLVIAWNCHPDRRWSMSKLHGILRDITMRDANTAYSVLRDPVQRAAYDRQLQYLAPKCKECKGTGKVQQRKGFTIKEVRCTACK